MPHLKYGSATIRATVGGATVDRGIQILPAGGYSFVDIVSPSTTAERRITSATLFAGDQVAVLSVVGGLPNDVTLHSDGTYSAPDEVTGFTYRIWRASTAEWTAVFSQGAAGKHLKYGAATVRVALAGNVATKSISILPPSNCNYVDLTTVNTNAARRITSAPDLEAGDQLEWGNVVGGTIASVTINADATFEADSAVTAFDVRAWDSATQTWGGWITQTVLATRSANALLTDRPNAVSATATVSLTEHLKYGSANVTVTIAGQPTSRSITISPPSGRNYVNLTSFNTSSASRVTAISGLEAGDQIEWANVVGGALSDVTVNADGTITAGTSVSAVDVRAWDASSRRWGAWATQSVLVTRNGSATLSDAQDSITSAGKTTQGAGAVLTDTSDALIAAVASTIRGSSALTDSAGTLSSAGTLRVTAVVLLNDAVGSLVASGTIVSQGATGSHLKYGPATIRVTVGAQQASRSVMLTPPAGRNFVDLTSINAASAYRITTSPDLAAGDQLEWGNVVGGSISDVTINPDATFDVAFAVTAFDVRAWDASASEWGPWATQTVYGNLVQLTSVNPTAALRLTALPDLEVGDLIEWGNVIGANIEDVIVYDDATFSAPVGIVSFDVRAWDADTQDWGPWATQTISMVVSGAALISDGADTFSGSAALRVSASSGLTDAKDSASGAGSLRIAVSAVIAISPDSLVASGTTQLDVMPPTIVFASFGA